ncbi:unnamed protein product [Mytilus coruscus]|uniref:NERD domain-containing protein n=1 Tax=Mytilus coruscus TaxID=42192 RepID=A0A6J8AGP9_MYTCO|nr:unnamed protein product [Mytilus coruscus]
MTEESDQLLSSPRQIPSFNKDTFRRAIIDGIDKQFQMGLKEQEIAVVSLTEEMDEQNKKLKGKQEEIDNLLKELQLKEKEETELLDKNNKLKIEIKERDLREVELLKEQKTTVVRLTKERDELKEKLKGKGEEIDNLSKLSLELQLKQKKEVVLMEENNKMKTEIKERNIREFAQLKEHGTTVVRHIEEMGAIKEKLKGKEEEIVNLSKLSRELQLKEKKEIELSDENSRLKIEITERNHREVELKVDNKTDHISKLTINSEDKIKENKLKHTVKENKGKLLKGHIPKGNALAVVAIEFGTTHSGWAYSFDRESKPCLPKIYTKGGWKGIDGLSTGKTHTVALFNPYDMLHSFGYEAEMQYAELIDEDAASEWKYFKGFNMALFVDETTQIEHQQRNLVGIFKRQIHK